MSGRYGLFAQAPAGRPVRLGDWHESYDAALAAYSAIGGDKGPLRRYRLRGARLGSTVDAFVMVRSAEDPAFATARQIDVGLLRVLSERGYSTRENAARAYAKLRGLNGKGGWFRERDKYGLGSGPVIAQGLDGLARVADVTERPDGFHYSAPADVAQAVIA